MSVDIEQSFVPSGSTASTSLVNIDELSVPVLLQSSGHIMAFMSLSSNISNNNDGHFAISIDGVDSPIVVRHHGNMNDIGSIGVGYRTQALLPPGVYHAKGRFCTTGGTLSIENATLIAMPLSNKSGDTIASIYKDGDNMTTTSNVLEDISGLSDNLFLQASGHIASFLFASTSSDMADVTLEFAVNINGQLIRSRRNLSSASDMGVSSVVGRTFTPVSSGLNLVKAQWSTDTGTGTMDPGILMAIGTEINSDSIPNIHGFGSGMTTISSSLEDIPDISGTIVLDQKSYIFAALCLDSSADMPGAVTNINISIDDVDQQSISRFHSNRDLGSQIIFVRSNDILSSGDHTVVGRWSVDSGEASGDNFHLFAMGGGLPSIFTSGTLFVNGFEPKPSSICPILDSTASIQIGDELITIYQDRIDAIINQLGKNVLLEFDPIRSPCPNCIFDPIRKRSTGIYISGGPRPFKRGRQCPWCKGRGYEETSVEKCIKCLVKWNPQDAENYGISLRDYDGVVRFKTFLTEFDDLIRAKTCISNHDIQDQLKLRVKLIKSPILIGLRESRYCISFWKLIDS